MNSNLKFKFGFWCFFAILFVVAELFGGTFWPGVVFGVVLMIATINIYNEIEFDEIEEDDK